MLYGTNIQPCTGKTILCASVKWRRENTGGSVESIYGVITWGVESWSVAGLKLWSNSLKWVAWILYGTYSTVQETLYRLCPYGQGSVYLEFLEYKTGEFEHKAWS